MTRVLSELLGAQEPTFRQRISSLEASSGHAGRDISLSMQVARAAKMKLRELGLDPNDTTGEELYAALQERVRQDDAKLVAALENLYGSDLSHVRIGKVLDGLPLPRGCFSLKIAVGKRILKKLPPKHVMKFLGYRSFDSMLRRESFLAVCAAAWIVEPASWRKALSDEYKKLTAADCEMRRMQIIAPSTDRWRALADAVVNVRKYNIIGLKEYGAIILLPLPTQEPPAATLAMLVLSLHEMNLMRAASTYLKLCQVRAHFGACVQTVASSDPVLGFELLDSDTPWQVVQRYYARFVDRFKADIFEPHVQKEDLSWHSIEKALSYLEPSLSFWNHTSTVGMLQNHQPVSCNVIDAVLNFCNNLPYEKRIVQYLRHNLWHELALTYLSHEHIEQSLLDGLDRELAPQSMRELL